MADPRQRYLCFLQLVLESGGRGYQRSMDTARSITIGDGIAALIDVDGTLVDSTYLHAIAWAAALRVCGFEIPTARAHRQIGMRGERLLEELLGEADAGRVAATAIAEHDRRFAALRDQVVGLPHAHELLTELAAHDIPVVLVSSADDEEIEHYLELLGVRDLVRAWTSASDGSRSKPDQEPVRIALRRSGRAAGVVIGDAPWDCLAASAAGMPAVAVLTGGFSRSELEQSGARAVYEHLGEIIAEVGALPGLHPRALSDGY